MSPSNVRLFGSLFVILTAAAIQVARADVSPEPVSHEVPVYYGDLNLDKTVGAEALITRIERAAKQACGGRPMIGHGYRIAKARYEACVRKAETDAVAAVNRPAVTTAYIGKNAPSTTRIATR